MVDQTIYCPGGSGSQTGKAVLQRYPEATIANCGKILEVEKKLNQSDNDYVVPIWNSHEGEVADAGYVWNLIEQAKIKISDIWAKEIQFWFVQRNEGTFAYGKIGSVKVAGTQCSSFLSKRNAELVQCALTTVAHDEYKAGAEWNGVLVAPGQGEGEAGYTVVDKNTANPNNFTSFVKLSSSKGYKQNEEAAVWLSGVAMRPLNSSLGETEQAFFSQLFESISNLEEAPKLIFVFKRTAKVGLLFEGAQLYAGDLLDAVELEAGDITVHEKAGEMSRSYSSELRSLFENKFPDLLRDDFILHKGVNTCLFACPTLGLYTHGYEPSTVEPVVRYYINKLFELIDNGVKCTEEQRELFDRHSTQWRKKKSQFMQFTTHDVNEHTET